MKYYLISTDIFNIIYNGVYTIKIYTPNYNIVDKTNVVVPAEIFKNDKYIYLDINKFTLFIFGNSDLVSSVGASEILLKIDLNASNNFSVVSVDSNTDTITRLYEGNSVKSCVEYMNKNIKNEYLYLATNSALREILLDDTIDASKLALSTIIQSFMLDKTNNICDKKYNLEISKVSVKNFSALFGGMNKLNTRPALEGKYLLQVIYDEVLYSFIMYTKICYNIIVDDSYKFYNILDEIFNTLFTFLPTIDGYYDLTLDPSVENYLLSEKGLHCMKSLITKYFSRIKKKDDINRILNFLSLFSDEINNKNNEILNIIKYTLSWYNDNFDYYSEKDKFNEFITLLIDVLPSNEILEVLDESKLYCLYEAGTDNYAKLNLAKNKTSKIIHNLIYELKIAHDYVYDYRSIKFPRNLMAILFFTSTLTDDDFKNSRRELITLGKIILLKLLDDYPKQIKERDCMDFSKDLTNYKRLIDMTINNILRKSDREVIKIIIENVYGLSYNENNNATIVLNSIKKHIIDTPIVKTGNELVDSINEDSERISNLITSILLELSI